MNNVYGISYQASRLLALLPCYEDFDVFWLCWTAVSLFAIHMSATYCVARTWLLMAYLQVLTSVSLILGYLGYRLSSRSMVQPWRKASIGMGAMGLCPSTQARSYWHIAGAGWYFAIDGFKVVMVVLSSWLVMTITYDRTSSYLPGCAVMNVRFIENVSCRSRSGRLLSPIFISLLARRFDPPIAGCACAALRLVLFSKTSDWMMSSSCICLPWFKYPRALLCGIYSHSMYCAAHAPRRREPSQVCHWLIPMCSYIALIYVCILIYHSILCTALTVYVVQVVPTWL